MILLLLKEMIYMQSSVDDAPRQKIDIDCILYEFGIIGLHNFCVRLQMSQSAMNETYRVSLSKVSEELKNDDYKVFSLMRAKVAEEHIENEAAEEQSEEVVEEQSEKVVMMWKAPCKNITLEESHSNNILKWQALDEGNGFLKSFSNSSILDKKILKYQLCAKEQRQGMKIICSVVVYKLKEVYGGINRNSNSDKVPKPLTKGGKILQCIIKKQRGKQEFKFFLQVVVDIFMPDNKINIETIFVENEINQNQMTDMYIEGDNLAIQTDNKELRFNRDGGLVAEINLRRSIFGTVYRVEDQPLLLPITPIPSIDDGVTANAGDQGELNQSVLQRHDR
jgi:hypothetical protein